MVGSRPVKEVESPLNPVHHYLCQFHCRQIAAGRDRRYLQTPAYTSTGTLCKD
jgi:hypothetical protein